jgi:hypothetical protein
MSVRKPNEYVLPLVKGALLAALASACRDPICNGCGKCVTPWLEWIHSASHDQIIEQIRIVRAHSARVYKQRKQELQEASDRKLL